MRENWRNRIRIGLMTFDKVTKRWKKIGYFSEIGILRTIGMILRRLRTTRLFSRNLLEEGVVKNNAKFTPECAVLYIIKIGERLFLKDGDKIKFLFS